ncbi:hypothetical protein DPM19_00045 [Actinomadura craniellae]|uniref:Hsp70 family protein n=1 Tax=Actinomadura craniellae TaxID=2231787 RepID=A0A365HC83_9ACTN|nr:hypothetical protein [Actinomadura craniellae]RAY16622.1 hypothetical protein DPM19_00045 [Actinomadura craniellae]
MTGPLHAALDVGAATTKLALVGAAAPVALERPTPAGGLAGFLRDLLVEGRSQVPGEPGSITVVTPEAWFDGGERGARAQEEMREIVAGLGWPETAWVGQVAAAAARAAARHRFEVPGPYLVCDAGASGVTVARCEVTGRTVLPCEVAEGGPGASVGGRAYETTFAGRRPMGTALDLPSLVREHGDLIRRVLDRTVDDRRGRTEPLLGEGVVTVAELARGFAPTAEWIGTAVPVLLAARPPAQAVVTGGFGEFPLVERAVRAATGVEPQVLGRFGAVEGALLMARGRARAAVFDVPDVSVAVSRVKDGLLESHWVRVNPRSAPYAYFRGDPLVVETGAESARIRLKVSGRITAVVPPPLAGGHHLALHPARSGPGTLVFRPVGGGPSVLVPLGPGRPRDDP